MTLVPFGNVAYRVNGMSAFFAAATVAILTPLWIPVDLVIFETSLALYLAALRVLASIAFALLALSYRGSDSVVVARWSLVWLLVIPTVAAWLEPS